jgi:GNAT superfamily N-acetyltransferase
VTEVFEALGTCYLALARAMIGSDPAASGRDQECVWARTPVSVSDMNRVMLPRLPSEAPDLDLRVVEIDGRFEGLAHSWWLDPGSRPGALEASLRWLSPRAIVGAVPAMAVELTELPPAERATDIEVELAAGRAALIEAGDLAARGFEVALDDGPGFEPLFARVALDPQSPVRVAVGRLGGRPAATALGCLAGDVLGVYSVATLPDARRRGLGRAVTLAVLRDGLDRGARLAVLESSAAGLGVYHGLGFREAGPFRVVSLPGPDGH